MSISDKFVRKYLRMAKSLCEENEACKSRAVGAVIVSAANRVISIGYNGAPAGLPHCDSREYLEEYLRGDPRVPPGCPEGTCPRRYAGCKPGESRDLCYCLCAEQNAILSAPSSVHGAAMFIYGGYPCANCAAIIVQTGISQVFWEGMEERGIDERSAWTLARGGVQVHYSPQTG